jgi:hypothetical protein
MQRWNWVSYRLLGYDSRMKKFASPVIEKVFMVIEQGDTHGRPT